MIFFSIIIPTYNRATMIGETIDTILNQTYPHFEVIVVDDGSTDNTKQIIEEKYGGEDKVRYYYKQNEERGVARNFGMTKAKGDYAVIFDSDDWMHSDHLSVIEKGVLKLQKGQYVNFIATKYQLKDSNGIIKKGGSSNLKEGWYEVDDMLKGNHFGCLYTINLHNQRLEYFPTERMYSTLEDWMFLLKNLQHDKIYLLDNVTITVRHHENQSMSMNQRVIQARKSAAEWGLKNLQLNFKQKKTLLAYSAFFCGIHQYLDFNSKESVKEAIYALKKGGIKKKFLFLLAKSILGRKFINQIRKNKR